MAKSVRVGNDTSSVYDNFCYVNERPVDDISLEFFYKPHTITLLTVAVGAVLYSVFTRNDDNI
ncbi:Phosphatidylserine synthase 1, partial [Stegodyphus mimosarum]